MAKQTRRALSISGQLYEAIKARAAEEGVTGTGLVERELRKLVGLEERSDTPRMPRKPKPVPVKPNFTYAEGCPTPAYSTEV